MGVIFFFFLFIATGGFDTSILLYFLMLYFELLIIIAISLLFSSFSTPILSSIFTLSLYLIGHVLWTFNEFKSQLTEPAIKYLTNGLYYVLPNLEKFNIKNAVVMKSDVSGGQVLNAILYALVYILAVLALSTAIFRRREFP
jgi:ABC-type transport system involved in multi-copper enzyme maturation permease subunit